MPQKIPKYGMTALWSSRKHRLIDSMGTVYNENLKEAVSTSLTLVLSDGKHKKEFVLPLTIVPRNYTTSEQQIRDFTQYLENDLTVNRWSMTDLFCQKIGMEKDSLSK